MKLIENRQAGLKLCMFIWLVITAGLSMTTNAAQIPFQSEWLKQHYAKRMQHFSKNPILTGDIVFIGDSITEQGDNWGAKFADLMIKNRGISGDMTYGVLARLNEVKANPPKAIFIMIGVNDIFNLVYHHEVKQLASISRNIDKITRELAGALPETQIFVQSILPDHRDFITILASAVNQQIKAINNKAFTYIDLHSVFVTPQGVLKAELTTDGTHLNASGYQLWQQQLQPIMDTLK